MVFINFPKTSRYEVQTHNYFEKYAADLGKFAKMFRNMKVGFGDLNFGTFWLLINGNIFLLTIKWVQATLDAKFKFWEKIKFSFSLYVICIKIHQKKLEVVRLLKFLRKSIISTLLMYKSNPLSLQNLQNNSIKWILGV